MKRLFHQFRGFFLRRDGATAAEYAIVASLIAAVIAATVMTLGQRVLALFESVKF
jgi:pilus assembly protein Flp/PilA